MIGVAGATLGGSGVTAMCAALAEALRARGKRVAVVSHGYGAASSMPRRVVVADRPEAVGDEALELARRLAPRGARVFVGRPRSRAIALAAEHADVVVLDGVLQRRGGGLAGSLLVLDGARPWGTGACPPAGNLRAPVRKLLIGASQILWAPPPEGQIAPLDAGVARSGRPVVTVPSRVTVTKLGCQEASPGVLVGRRVGLVAGVARVERVVATLASHRVRLVRVVSLADHASTETFRRAEQRLGAAEVDAWVTTSKCATKLGESFAGAPLLVLRRHLDVPDGVVDAVLGSVEHPAGRGACLSARERAMVPPCSGTA